MICQLTLSKNGKYVVCGVCKRKLPHWVGVDAIRECLSDTPGPGDQLHQLIEQITKQRPGRECGCKDRISKMNRWGVLKCRRNIDEITDWIVEQATKHDWKLRVPGIGSLARLAPEGVQRWSCRQLALLAIRRSERQRPRE